MSEKTVGVMFALALAFAVLGIIAWCKAVSARMWLRDREAEFAELVEIWMETHEHG